MTEPNPTETPAEHPPAARSPRADVFIAYPGPDADLTRGLHDALSRQGLAVFGEVRIPEFLPSLFRNGSPSRANEELRRLGWGAVAASAWVVGNGGASFGWSAAGPRNIRVVPQGWDQTSRPKAADPGPLIYFR
ncbi:MAG: hypothetical protein HUU55_21205 [Myxococcales bacterium]|nr:hypothetical protein [Myxococcales bacterium]